MKTDPFCELVACILMGHKTIFWKLKRLRDVGRIRNKVSSIFEENDIKFEWISTHTLLAGDSKVFFVNPVRYGRLIIGRDNYTIIDESIDDNLHSNYTKKRYNTIL